MGAKRISTISGAILLAFTTTASAGPMSVPSAKIIAPPQTQTDPVYYRYYGGYYGWNPGAAVAGTALGLLALGIAGAAASRPAYGYGYGYGYPYYGSYGYNGRPYYGYYGGPYYYGRPYYRYYGYHPHYRHYGYWHGRHYGYGGGVHTGRSIGYRHIHRGYHAR